MRHRFCLKQSLSLCSRLLEEGNNKIVILSRHSEKIKPPIQAIAELNELKDNDAFDVVINPAWEFILSNNNQPHQKNHSNSCVKIMPML
jgi:NAD dependent epimerase/dehydratase family enzyme